MSGEENGGQRRFTNGVNEVVSTATVIRLGPVAGQEKKYQWVWDLESNGPPLDKHRHIKDLVIVMMIEVAGDRRRRRSTGGSLPEDNSGYRHLRGYGIQGNKLDVV